MTKATSRGRLRDRANGASPDNLVSRVSSLFTLANEDATELLLLRHAEPDYQAVKGMEGLWNPSLSDHGRWQAMRLAMRLRSLTIDALYTSPLRRTRETAVFTCVAKDLPMAIVPELREIEFGNEAWGALGTGREAFASEIESAFLTNACWDVLPGCESSWALRRRVGGAIEAILAQHGGQRVAIVTHGGVINAFLSMLLDIPRDMFFLPDHASLSIVRHARGLYGVRSLNDAAHLLPMFTPDRASQSAVHYARQLCAAWPFNGADHFLPMLNPETEEVCHDTSRDSATALAP